VENFHGIICPYVVVNPCTTNTPKRTPSFRQLNFSGRKIAGSAPNQGAATGGAISGNSSQVSTPRRSHSSSPFKMVGHDPNIRLLEFWGVASKDPEKNLFICENIGEAKHITGEDTKLLQLTIMLRDRALDWYMILAVKSPPRTTRTIADVKKILINSLHKLSSED
jgi:hypothetical protein